MADLTLEPTRTAIVVIDLQKGTVGRATQPHAAATVVANTALILRAARRAGAVPILVHVGGSPDAPDRLRPTADEPMPAAPLPPDWSELVPELERAPGDLVILKRQWGAFYGTDLELQLRRRRLTTLVLCGIATEYGVESTARDAYERGFDQVFVSDAMAARTAQAHEHCLTRIFPRMGRVRDTRAVVAALGG
ncbi:MAG TPA: hydrolase [Thermoanaerobaculaceae bacterium]|nr:hydrolase [Thermoanaerobaculaceae bacterium]